MTCSVLSTWRNVEQTKYRSKKKRKKKVPSPSTREQLLSRFLAKLWGEKYKKKSSYLKMPVRIPVMNTCRITQKIMPCGCHTPTLSEIFCVQNNFFWSIFKSTNYQSGLDEIRTFSISNKTTQQKPSLLIESKVEIVSQKLTILITLWFQKQWKISKSILKREERSILVKTPSWNKRIH